MACRRNRAAGIIIFFGISGSVSGLHAQDGSVLRFRFGHTLEATNTKGNTRLDEDEGVQAVTTLGFDYVAQTPSQSLSAQLNSGFVYNLSNQSQDEFRLNDPDFALGYQRQTRSSELSVNARYQRIDISDANFLPPEEVLDEEFSTDLNGQRELTFVSTRLAFGTDGPLQLSLSHNYRETDYSKTVDPGLRDSEVQSLRLGVEARLSPVSTLSAFTARTERDEIGPGARDRVTTTSGLSVRQEIDKTLTATAGISYTEIENTFAGTTTTIDGLGFDLGLNKRLPNGTLGLSLSRDEGINGARDQFAISRSLALPRGDLSLQVGASRTEGFSAEPVVTAAWGYDVSQSDRLQLRLSRRGGSNRNDEEIVSSRLDLQYQSTINSWSSITGGLQLASQDVLGADGGAQTSLRARLNYNYSIDRDWQLVSGYEFTTVRNDARSDRDSSRVFVGISRQFNFRP